MSKKRAHKLNEEIYSLTVRITGEGIESKILTRQEALDLSINLAKDMILINENANPPVVKLEDYNKFLYQQEQKEKENKKNSKKTETKEIGLSVNIAENDMKTKARKAIEFFNDGDKVRLTLLLKSREKAAPERGELVMLKFLELVKEHGVAETLPKFENNKWACLIKPKK